MNDKINIIFDATAIVDIFSKDSRRSGIFFTAFNVFKEIVKRDDVNLVLICDLLKLDDVKRFVKVYCNGKNIDILTNSPNIPLSECYYKLWQIKDYAKKNHLGFILAGIKILMFVISLQLKSKIKEYEKQIKEKYSNGYVFFSPQFNKPKLIRNIGIPKYMIIYDTVPLIFPQYYTDSDWFVKFYAGLSGEDKYFSISDSTRNDVLKYCPQIKADKIQTALLACDERFVPCDADRINSVKQKYNIPADKKYIFSLCTLEPRKNLIRAVKTFIEFIKKNNIDDMVYVLGGGQWEHFIGKLQQEIEDLGEYKDKILKLGYVDDEDLAPLYSGAEWFVYTSQYEGFGLPPLEAMNCACPVITSNNSSLPEVVGDAAIAIDYDSDEQHIASYEKYYYHPEIREEYRQKGLERAKMFSWAKCVNQMVETIKKDIQS